MASSCEVEVVEENPMLAASIVGKVMGERDSYYAMKALEAVEGSHGLVAMYRGRPLGSIVGYPARGEGPTIGVIYYVAVLSRCRGRGIGKVLVASIEEMLEDEGVELFASTIDGGNERSIRLFSSMGYSVYSIGEAAELYGWRAVIGVLHAACSYEEDMVALKGEDLHSKLSKVTEDSYREVWWYSCYKPWLARWYNLDA